MILQEEPKSNTEQELEQAWQALQSTPSYAERYQANPQLGEQDDLSLVRTFCGPHAFQTGWAYQHSMEGGHGA